MLASLRPKNKYELISFCCSFIGLGYLALGFLVPGIFKTGIFEAMVVTFPASIIAGFFAWRGRSVRAGNLAVLTPFSPALLYMGANVIAMLLYFVSGGRIKLV